MKKILVSLLVFGVLLALSATACSALPGPIRQDLATAIAAPTSTPMSAPTLAATPQPKGSNAPAAANANPLAQLKRLGLEGGIVVSNDGNTLMLKIGKVSEQLTLAPTTLIVVPGQTNAKSFDIQVGDRVIAKLPNADANAAPDLVLAFPKGYAAANIGLGLVQTRPSATSFTLRTRSGSRTVTPSANTLVVDMTGGQPVIGQLTDLKRGSGALVIGTPAANSDTLTAQTIVLLDVNALRSNSSGKNGPTPTPTP